MFVSPKIFPVETDFPFWPFKKWKHWYSSIAIQNFYSRRRGGRPNPRNDDLFQEWNGRPIPQVEQGSEAATATTAASNSSGEGSLLVKQSHFWNWCLLFFLAGDDDHVLWWFFLIRCRYFEGNPANNPGLLIQVWHAIINSERPCMEMLCDEHLKTKKWKRKQNAVYLKWHLFFFQWQHNPLNRV